MCQPGIESCCRTLTQQMKVGNRVSYQGDLCTIKWIGELPQWAGVQAYGVEWDDPSRGKHNGWLNNIQYFNTVVPMAGSFVKASRKKDGEVTFNQAVEEKYASEVGKSEVLHVGKNKIIENVGFDKFRKRQQQLEKLPIISVDGFRISGCECDEKIDLISVHTLDLSHNLFTEFEVVYEICKDLENLRILVLNGNRLNWNGTNGLDQVVELSLTNCLIDIDSLDKIAWFFPNLRVLSLANNRLVSVPKLPFNCLQTLDLSFNNLTTIPSLEIPDLNVSNNSSTDTITTIATLPITESLNISNNDISWSDIDALASSAPKLTNLRITTNDKDDALFLGRLGNIITLNGRVISPRERTDADLYFMTKVAQQSTPHPPHARWEELCKKYGEPVVRNSEQAKDKLSNKIVTVNVICEQNIKSVKLLRTLTIQKLKTQLAKQFNLSPFNITLTHENNTLDEPLRSIEFYNVQQNDNIYIK